MSAGRIVAFLMMISLGASGPGFLRAAAAQPAPGAPPGPPETQGVGLPTEATPPRVSYLTGEVSFWRPGAQDWDRRSSTLPWRRMTPSTPGRARALTSR